MDLCQIKRLLTDQFKSGLAGCGARLEALHDTQHETEAEIQAVRRTIHFIQGLRVGISVPALFSTQMRTKHWVFVRKLEIETVGSDLVIRELECLVIPEVLQPQVRWERPTGADSGPYAEVIHSPEMLAQEIVNGLADVTVGSWDDALTVPCDVCGTAAPLVCHRRLDHEDDKMDISVGVLCPHCLRFTENAGIFGFSRSIPLLVSK